MWEVIDKAGLNRLLVPYRSLFLSSPPHIYSAMAPIHNSYLVPFDPLGAPGPTILTATQEYNKMFKHLKWGLAVTPYPDLATVYRQLVISNAGDDMFDDLYLGDMYSFFFSCLVTLLMIK
jgi:hypothetical protein